MTTVVLRKERGLTTFVACGHATGSEQACAAVSTLMYTLLGYLKNSDISIVKERMDPGCAEIAYKDGKDTDVLTDVVRIGFEQLRASYPGYVTFFSDL